MTQEESTMTYAQALMIVKNATCYKQAEIQKAAAFILGTLSANEEDCLDAGNALGYADMMGVKVVNMPGAHCSELDEHPFSGMVSAANY